ncbi:MAG: hypothetical protein AVDCRST_MAG88-3489 [uncultured Thermomicrobiales bacterium]|uniref:Uncharacterized protein n=1 Tax=uncultured Thermomicrobiales bacterium TaxID=1645740 RepID=A0A6J4VMF3_9BACT|nr:MAG: hypothetical protein AVDCRST_MAG88-3489 [uncultured Thermomicrobiales bacterium]
MFVPAAPWDAGRCTLLPQSEGPRHALRGGQRLVLVSDVADREDVGGPPVVNGSTDG